MFEIRDIQEKESKVLGRLLVKVYSHLDGFPKPEDQPGYYEMLQNIGDFTLKPGTRILVAVSNEDSILGGGVYFSDMAQYGSGGTATKEENASGIRLLGVDPASRGKGVGRSLTQACIDIAIIKGHANVILHTTNAMKTAWQLYENMGFKRALDLDFDQHGLAVFGFRKKLDLNIA